MATTFYEYFLASFLHDPKCSITSGTMLTTEPTGSLCCLYVEIFLVSLRFFATPVVSAELWKTSELQGFANKISKPKLELDSASNMIMAGLHSKLV